MDEVVKEHSSSGNSAKPKLLRYALRSSTKSKEQNLDAPNSSKSNRGRSTPSSVSKSVGVLDFSGKDKSRSAKPPRRYSIPSPKLVGNNTPISETRAKRFANGKGPQSRNQTPISDISRTSTRARFNLLSSASYWLNQIKLSESAAKHSISLGFFKLALEAGCEKMKDELKSYVHRHQLAAELGEQARELFERYNIAENPEQPQVSETISQVPEDSNGSSDDEVRCSSPSTKGTRNLKPKSLNTADCTKLTPVTTESIKKETYQKNKQSQSSLREKLRMKSANSRPAIDSGDRKTIKKPEKATKQESNKKSEVKKQGNKSLEFPVSPSSVEDNAPGNKENMDVLTTDAVTEVV